MDEVMEKSKAYGQLRKEIKEQNVEMTKEMDADY